MFDKFWKRFVSLKASILSTKIILYNDFELIDWKLSDVYVSPQPMVKWSRKMFWHTKIQRPFLWRYDFVDKSTPSTLVSHFKNTKTSGLNINCQDAGLLTSLVAWAVRAWGTAPTCHSPFPLRTISEPLSRIDWPSRTWRRRLLLVVLLTTTP